MGEDHPPLGGNVVGCWSWDVKEDRLFSDAALADYFGLTGEQAATGRSINLYLRAVHIEDRVRLRRAIEDAVEQGGTLEEVYRVQTISNGSRWISASGKCFHETDGSPSVFLGYILDVGSGSNVAPGIGTLSHYAMAAKRIANRQGLDFAEYLLDMLIIELRKRGEGLEDIQ